MTVRKACLNSEVAVLDTSVLQGPKGDTGARGLQGPKGDKGDTGSVGPQGIQGSNGAKGDPGEAGAAGQSAFDTLASGTTVRGFIETGFGGYGSFQALVPQLLTNDDIIIARNKAVTDLCPDLSCLSDSELEKDASGCTGSFENPTAPGGKVCIYPRLIVAESRVRMEGRVSEDRNFFPNLFWKSHFELVSTVSGVSLQLDGTFAYTAP